jgi:hypothetical protein
MLIEKRRKNSHTYELHKTPNNYLVRVRTPQGIVDHTSTDILEATLLYYDNGYSSHPQKEIIDHICGNPVLCLRMTRAELEQIIKLP